VAAYCRTRAVYCTRAMSVSRHRLVSAVDVSAEDVPAVDERILQQIFRICCTRTLQQESTADILYLLYTESTAGVYSRYLESAVH
jgi:hypothetical protein